MYFISIKMKGVCQDNNQTIKTNYFFYFHINLIFIYSDQLSALESKIPMHELRDVPFKCVWK